LRNAIPGSLKDNQLRHFLFARVLSSEKPNKLFKRQHGGRKSFHAHSTLSDKRRQTCRHQLLHNSFSQLPQKTSALTETIKSFLRLPPRLPVGANRLPFHFIRKKSQPVAIIANIFVLSPEFFLKLCIIRKRWRKLNRRSLENPEELFTN
jgi:hypothetical protein